MTKLREFDIVYGPGVLTKESALHTERAIMILSQNSNWRSVVDTAGNLWSVLESNQATRILCIRLPNPCFPPVEGPGIFSVLRLYESHTAYEKDLATLKTKNGKLWRLYQEEHIADWENKPSAWMKLSQTGYRWTPRAPSGKTVNLAVLGEVGEVEEDAGGKKLRKMKENKKKAKMGPSEAVTKDTLKQAQKEGEAEKAAHAKLKENKKKKTKTGLSNPVTADTLKQAQEEREAEKAANAKLQELAAAKLAYKLAEMEEEDNWQEERWAYIKPEYEEPMYAEEDGSGYDYAEFDGFI